MKRGGFKKPTQDEWLLKLASKRARIQAKLPRNASIGLRRTSLSPKGKSETSLTKERIQDTARDIVIIRDGGCIFRDHKFYGVPGCNGYRKDGELILQADHLVTRGNSATYADTRLIVCVCQGHHGWKSVAGNLNKPEYDACVKKLISPERVKLWEYAEATKHKVAKMDWSLELIALEQELRRMQKAP